MSVCNHPRVLGATLREAEADCGSQRQAPVPLQTQEGQKGKEMCFSTVPPSPYFLEIIQIASELLQLKPPLLLDGSFFSGIAVTGEGRTAPHQPHCFKATSAAVIEIVCL